MIPLAWSHCLDGLNTGKKLCRNHHLCLQVQVVAARVAALLRARTRANVEGPHNPLVRMHLALAWRAPVAILARSLDAYRSYSRSEPLRSKLMLGIRTQAEEGRPYICNGFVVGGSTILVVAL